MYKSMFSYFLNFFQQNLKPKYKTVYEISLQQQLLSLVFKLFKN